MADTSTNTTKSPTYALYSGVVINAADGKGDACISGFVDGPVPTVGDTVIAPNGHGIVASRRFIYSDRGLQAVVLTLDYDNQPLASNGDNAAMGVPDSYGTAQFRS